VARHGRRSATQPALARNKQCSSWLSTPIPVNRWSSIVIAESNWPDAVAASCANGFGVPPTLLASAAYIDGGYRANENADLAAGYARVLVLSHSAADHGIRWSGAPSRSAGRRTTRSGSKVETIFPDTTSQNALGVGLSMMDPATRTPSARAGYDQGRALAEQLNEFWH